MTPEQLAELFTRLKELHPVFYEELEKQLIKNAESHGIDVNEIVNNKN